MSCSELFQGVIDNQKENLKYLRQLGATSKALEQEQYGKFKALIIGVLGDAYRGQIEKLLGESISYESLVGALQLIAVAKPSLFGSVLEKELTRLREFFESERRRFNLALEYIDEMLEKLTGDWSIFDDLDNLQKQHRLQLNELFNKQLPSSIRNSLRAKSRLITAENMIYNGNVFKDDEDRFLAVVGEARQYVRAAKDDLGAEEISIIERFLHLLMLWEQIQAAISRLTRVDSPMFRSISLRFDTAGQNLLRFLKAFRAAVMNLSEAIEILNANELEMDGAWSKIHNHMFLSKGTDSGVLQTSSRFHGAIRQYIETETSTPVPVPLPYVAKNVDDETFPLWERQANIYQPLKNNWQSHYDEVLRLLTEIATGPTARSIRAVETIYSPIVDSIIGAYQAATTPLWGAISAVVASLNNVFARVMQGRSVSGSLSSQLYALRMRLVGIGNAVEDTLNFFEGEDPIGNLREAMGITTPMSAIIGGFVSFFDTLGLDHLSNLLDAGDLLGVFNTPKGEASNAGQLLKCLKGIKDAGSLAQKYIAEMQNIAASEVLRKQKLEQTTDVLVAGAAQSQEERIQELETLLANFNAAMEA